MKQKTRVFARLLPLLFIFTILTACSANAVPGAPSFAITPASQVQSQARLFSEISSAALSEVSSMVSSKKASSKTSSVASKASASSTAAQTVVESGSYTAKDDVALYIHLFGHLPGNFITKSQASALGWSGGGLEPYAPGKCIGGDYFGNYEGLLPDKDGRSYTECDICTLGAASRGARRIVFSNDGLVYFTADHYESFTLLYGDPNA
ncbi:MAG TPA: ribonuclease domain-containing protein [Oscillospiraceae bacterium]|nr:ribonuclease domain-containing protein [Oscillospiraceae bacterium]HPS34093.1 ribonuclease domain-containing protein [Oscillospiraceae bacterium]